MEILSTIDLNLLVLFKILYEERSVSSAAKRLGVTQSAVSHGLARLRILFSDPLFTRSPQGFIASEKSTRIIEDVAAALSLIEQNLFKKKDFDPQTMQRAFRVMTTDLLEATLIPEVLRNFEKQAPLSQLIFVSTKIEFPAEQLQSGHADMAIAGFYKEIPANFYKQNIVKSDFVSTVRADHPRIRNSLSEKAFFHEKHIMIAPGGNLPPLSDTLKMKRRDLKKYILGMSSFLASGWVLEQSDAILTAPDFLAKLINERFRLKSFPTPLKMPTIQISNFWHERSQHDAEHIWLRKLISSAAGKAAR